MNKENIEIIKKLREKTGLGIIECKEILINSNFNFNIALKDSNNLNKLKAEKKCLNKISKGKIFSGVSYDFKYGIIFEINSETNFIYNKEEFIYFSKKIINFSLLNKIDDINYIKNKFNNNLLNLISKFNENIKFGNIIIMNGEHIYSYIHIGKIGVIINSSKVSNLNILKEISMHIIFNKPIYINKKDIPKNIIENEYNIQYEIIKKLDTNKTLFDKILTGKIEKFKNSISLNDQKFILDNNKTIENILNENKLSIINFKIIELFKK